MPDVDATDARLLLALNEDPRASVMALSQRLGLARNTVQARLSRMESNGVLAPFERRVRPEALGYRLSAYITVQVVQRSLAEVSDALAHIPEVLEVTGLSGVADLLEREGLCAYAENPRHRRAKLLTLSANGGEALAQIEAAQRGWCDALGERIGEGTLNEARNALARVLEGVASAQRDSHR